MPTHNCACGAVYHFDNSIVGRRAKCKKCGTVFHIQADMPTNTYEVSEIEDEPAPAVLRNVVTVSGPNVSLSAPAPSAVSSYGQDVVDYLKSLLKTFLFPFSLHNLMMMGIIWFILMVGQVASFAPLFGFLASLIVSAFYAAFLFEVIGSAANAEPELPTIEVSTSFVEEIVYPALKMLASRLLVILPVIAYLILLAVIGEFRGPTGGLTAMNNPPTVLLIGAAILAALHNPLNLCVEPSILSALMLGGMILWPIVVLCVALGELSSLLRIDLVILTILRTLPGYILAVAMVYGTYWLGNFLMGVAGAATVISSGANVTTILNRMLVLSLFFQAIILYTDVVAMRAVGLYYHHMKRYFAWSWE